jgi:hypothetical protein
MKKKNWLSSYRMLGILALLLLCSPGMSFADAIAVDFYLPPAGSIVYNANALGGPTISGTLIIIGTSGTDNSLHPGFNLSSGTMTFGTTHSFNTDNGLLGVGSGSQSFSLGGQYEFFSEGISGGQKTVTFKFINPLYSGLAEYYGLPPGASGLINLFFTGNTVTSAHATLTSPVPVPAAAWLLGSGLIGLLGVRRKMRS